MTQEGLTTLSVAWDLGTESGESKTLTRPRRVGDKYTWVMNLPTVGFASKKISPLSATIETATFQLRIDELLDTDQPRRYWIGFRDLCHPVLRHPLLVLERPFTETFQPPAVLWEQLDEMTMIE